MKKIFPSLVICFVFGVMVILQMLVHGQRITATDPTESTAKHAAFESELSKLNSSTTKGDIITLKSIKEPFVIVNFWASWCQPCIAEFASMNQLLKKYPDKIRIIGINSDVEDELKLIAKTEKKYELMFDSIADPDGELAEKFNITQVPASIIYYKGKVIYFNNKETDFLSPKILGLIDSKI